MTDDGCVIARGQGKVTQTTLADAVKYMDFTQAVARSVLTGQTISLPLTP